jgi:hypothetical protein
MADDGTDKHSEKINYSTDYLIDQLQNSQKMVSQSKRLDFIKEENESMMSDYVTEDNKYIGDEDDYYSKNKSDERSILDDDKHNSNSHSHNEYEYDNDYNKEKSNKKNIYNDLFGEDDDYDILPKNQQLIKRLEVMSELGELVKYNGTRLTQSYDIDSDYYTMKCELMIHKNIKAKDFFVSNLTNMTCYFASGVESANKKYNPFDLDLSGWAEGVESQSTELTDIWSEMYTKHGSPGKNTGPEMRLFYALIIGPIMYDKSKKKEEEDRKKLRQYEQNENVQRQMRQVKQMNYANKMTEQPNMEKQMKEQAEMIRQQREMLKKQQNNLERANLEKENIQRENMNKNRMRDEEIKKNEFEKMQQFYKLKENPIHTQNNDKRNGQIEKQLNTIQHDIKNMQREPIPDKREDEIKNILKKMENETLDDETENSTIETNYSEKSSKSSYSTASSDSVSSTKSKKSAKSIFSKSGGKNSKRIISIKTN